MCVDRDYVIPFGIRLYVKKAARAVVGVPFRKTTGVAASFIRECKACAGVKVMVLLGLKFGDKRTACSLARLFLEQ
jgi:hypothetical protein